MTRKRVQKPGPSEPVDIHTQAVHAGEGAPRPDFSPVSTPIYQTVGYVYDSMDDLDAIFGKTRPGFVYPRYGTPTNAALEGAVAALEGGEAALSFASGMAALHAALLAAGVAAGRGVVASHDLYGATYSLLDDLFQRLGARVSFIDVTDLSEVRRVLEEIQPRVLLCETLSNPLMRAADVPRLADLAHDYGADLLVDNTFATPYLYCPLAGGADYAIHSTTKYLGGHGDVMGGVVVTTAGNCERLFEITKMVGGCLGPTEAWLTLRGIKTLPLRMTQHCRNAQTVADWLARHPRILRVNYPGLASHPQHRLANQLFRDGSYGGMISFEMADGDDPVSSADRETVYRFMERLHLVLPATTLGDVYSLVLHPASSSHRALTPDQQRHVGIAEGLVRLSVGIEAVPDIIADLDQALDAILVTSAEASSGFKPRTAE
jgi:cystathionine beta-lyase/cystathionine gamma-synthase